MPDDGGVSIPKAYLERAARPGAEATVRERLPQKLKQIAGDGRLVSLVKEAYAYAVDPRVPPRYKVLGVATLLYLLNPFDLIPDFLPGVGYLDDAAALAAFVVSVRKIVDAVKDASTEVVSHAVSEVEEAVARRGIGQVCLALWATTLAASIGLAYQGARLVLLPPVSGPRLVDPFFVGCMAAAAFGLAYSVRFAHRVWQRYTDAPPSVKEPLAYAIVSLVDWRTIAAMSLPVATLLVLIGIRIGLGLRG
jgi:uncharacterized membrane protein YkvA (DUF1232 family)